MDILDFLKQDKMYQVAEAIESYGREVITVNGQKMIKSNLANAQIQRDGARTIDVIDFKVLEKGCETWFKGEPYPTRFCFQESKQEALHRTKRIIPTIFCTIGRSKIIGSLYFWKNWKDYVDFIHYSLESVITDVKYYNQPTRELYRVLSDRGIDKIRNILCAVVEYDSAYRFRFQDMATELDKRAFESNPTKELKRLIDVYQKREGYGNMITLKFGGSIPVFMLYLRFNKRFQNAIKSIVMDFDQNETKFSVEDTYWRSKLGDNYCYEIS